MRKISVIILIVLFFGTFTFAARSVNFKLGMFYPAMESDLWDTNYENLSFSKDEFNAPYYGIEYEYFVGEFLSFSLEGGSYSKTIYSSYEDYVYDDNSPINQNIYLRISGVEMDAKFYPLGYRRLLFPYLGGGVGIYSWKYEQWGDFIDFEYGTIQEGYADTLAVTPGFNLKGGFIFRFSKNIGVSFETKYQYLKGTLSYLFEGFERFDLSGLTYSIGINFFLR